MPNFLKLELAIKLMLAKLRPGLLRIGIDGCYDDEEQTNSFDTHFVSFFKKNVFSLFYLSVICFTSTQNQTEIFTVTSSAAPLTNWTRSSIRKKIDFLTDIKKPF